MSWLKNTVNNAVSAVKNWIAPKALAPTAPAKKAPSSNPANNPGSSLPAPGTPAPVFGSVSATASTATPNKVPEYNKTINDFYEGDAAAQAKAAAAINPYYDTQTSLSNDKYNTTVSRAGEDYNAGSTSEIDQLNQFLKESGLAKTRTAEDLRTSLDLILADKGQTRAETSYDRVRQNRQLLGELSGNGLQFGGMAAQAGADASKGRLLANNKAEAGWTAQENAANTQSNRSNEDISNKEYDRKYQDISTLGSKSQYWDEITGGMTQPEKDALAKGSLATTQERTIADAATAKTKELSTLDDQRKFAIAQSVNDEWNKAYDQWKADMSAFGAKYGVSI